LNWTVTNVFGVCEENNLNLNVSYVRRLVDRQKPVAPVGFAAFYQKKQRTNPGPRSSPTLPADPYQSIGQKTLTDQVSPACCSAQPSSRCSHWSYKIAITLRNKKIKKRISCTSTHGKSLLQPEQSSDGGDPRALPKRTVPKVLKTARCPHAKKNQKNIFSPVALGPDDCRPAMMTTMIMPSMTACPSLHTGYSYPILWINCPRAQAYFLRVQNPERRTRLLRDACIPCAGVEKTPSRFRRSRHGLLQPSSLFDACAVLYALLGTCPTAGWLHASFQIYRSK